MRPEEQALDNAPPCLSRLTGVERDLAIRARHEANRARWLRDREQSAGMLAGIMRRIGL